MINGIKKGTIVSTTEDRLTLLNWLKKLEKTLSDDTLTDIAFTDDNGNVSLVLTFEDGTTKNVAFPYDMRKFAKNEDLNNILKLEIKTESFESFFTKTILEDGTLDFDLTNDIPNGLYIYKPDSSHDSGFNFLRQISLIVLGNALSGSYNDFLGAITPFPIKGGETSITFSEGHPDEAYYIYVIGSIIYIDTHWEL